MATHPENFPANASWYTKLTNRWPLMIDDQSVHTTAFAFFFKEDGKWKFFRRVKENWQYVNAVFSIRLGFPFAIFFQIRWMDKVIVYPKWIPIIGGSQEKQYYQEGIGWKQSGRFAFHSRLENDSSAADGYHPNMPNSGQAQGFNYGGK